MRLLVFVLACIAPVALWAQDLRIMTVTRAPFSVIEDGKETGFSLDLWSALSKDLGWEYEIVRVERFADMLAPIEAGNADAAIANISITASREQVMDFTQPIFESGIQIMTRTQDEKGSIWGAVFSRDLVLSIIGAFVLLFGGGMLMWHFERKHQEYFDMPAKHAMFPAFWWALNLVVNGGFEERQPRSPLGRLFGVCLVLSSLFAVSLFVAHITASLTVEAIQSNVNGVNDLYGKDIGTVAGSTTADFLERRDLSFTEFDSPTLLLAAFEQGEIEIVVFDAPILAYYVSHQGKGKARLVGSTLLPENYGIALPSESNLAEPINQSLLKLRENGTYAAIYRKWFGSY